MCTLMNGKASRHKAYRGDSRNRMGYGIVHRRLVASVTTGAVRERSVLMDRRRGIGSHG